MIDSIVVVLYDNFSIKMECDMLLYGVCVCAMRDGKIDKVDGIKATIVCIVKIFKWNMIFRTFYWILRSNLMESESQFPAMFEKWHVCDFLYTF